MLRLYKDLKTGYYAASITGAAALTLCGVWAGNWLPGILAALVWVILCALFFYKRAQKRVKRINEKRTMQCQTGAYIEACETLLNHIKKPKEKWIFLMNLAVGYLEAGEGGKALQLLAGLAPQTAVGPTGAAKKAVYYNNLAVCYLALEETENAQAATAALKEALGAMSGKDPSREPLCRCCENAETLIAMRRGCYDGAAAQFLKAFAQENTLIGKVSAQYRLAYIYLHEGDAENAEKSLLFVAQNGGDTYYAKKAQETLASLQGETE